MHESMGLVALGFDYGAHWIGVAMWRNLTMRMIGLIEGKDKPTRGEGNFAKGLFILLALMALQANRSVAAKGVLLDSFEELKGWNALPSGGAHMEIAQDAGHTDMGMRLDVDLQTGGRYILGGYRWQRLGLDRRASV
jgi:hypothetical protein